MLRFVTDAASRTGPTRREWLRISSLAGLGWAAGLGNVRADSAVTRGTGFGQAKSVVFVFPSGGQSQLDTWDPKPLAPAEIRGEFDSIATAVTGTRFCEHLPRLAQLADKFALLRSLSHEDLDHGTAAYLALTGYYHKRRSANPPLSPTDHPTYAAVVKKMRPGGPSFAEGVHLNGPAYVPEIIAPGQNGGFLGREAEPLLIGDASEATLAVPGLTPQPELPPVRIDGRWNLRQTLDGYAAGLEAGSTSREMDQMYQRALALLAEPRTRAAFDLSAETPETRDRYGRHRAGTACLLARRLVEAQVPWITVILNHNNRGQDQEPDNPDAYGWDTHNDVFMALKKYLLPRFDASFSTLLLDLEERGLLDTTLVVCMGEFGRAPLVALERTFAGGSPGRKHWAACYSCVMAGAGIKGGQIFGASDRFGAYPAAMPIGPWDVAATMFHALGIDPGSHFLDGQDRPYAVSCGNPLTALYG